MERIKYEVLKWVKNPAESKFEKYNQNTVQMNKPVF